MIPLYLLQRELVPNGLRLEKMLPIDDNPTHWCGVCGKYAVRPDDDTSWEDGKWMCKKCTEQYRAEHPRLNYSAWQLPDHYRRGPHLRAIPGLVYNTDVVVESGNLTNNDYRFWIGTRAVTGGWSKCRACGEECWSPEERERHKEDPKAIIAGDSCTRRLVRVYDHLSAKCKCVSCGIFTIKRRYGVPICDNECENAFRFDPQQPIAFTLEVAQEDSRCREEWEKLRASKKS